MNLTVTHAFPENLPLPAESFSGVISYPTLTSAAGSPVFEKRQRFEIPYPSLSVTWVFTQEEYVRFLRFYNSTLGVGCASFRMQLRFPTNEELTEWMVKFEQDLDVTNEENFVGVTAILRLIHKTYLPDLATTL